MSVRAMSLRSRVVGVISSLSAEAPCDQIVCFGDMSLRDEIVATDPLLAAAERCSPSSTTRWTQTAATSRRTQPSPTSSTS